jgi:hypothetical protein
LYWTKSKTAISIVFATQLIANAARPLDVRPSPNEIIAPAPNAAKVALRDVATLDKETNRIIVDEDKIQGRTVDINEEEVRAVFANAGVDLNSKVSITVSICWRKWCIKFTLASCS